MGLGNAANVDNLTQAATVSARGLATRQTAGGPTDVWSHSYEGMSNRLSSAIDDPAAGLRDLARSTMPAVPTVEGMIRGGVHGASPAAAQNSVQQTAAAIGEQWSALTGTGPNAPQGALQTIGAGFGLLTSFEQLVSAPLSMIPFPAIPSVRITDFDVGLPHGHTHPPNLVPPAPMIMLPSTGPVIPIPILSGASRTLINGMPAGRCGDMGLGIWCGGYFPMYEIFLGSSSVWIEGSRAARVGVDITKHCIFSAPKPNDPPLGPMVGFTCTSSPNVLIGGIPMPSLTNLAIGAAFKGLFKGLGAVGRGAASFSRRFAAFRKALVDRMPKGFWKCRVFRGEPIHLATGEVYVEQEDFDLRGPISLSWTRQYRSGATRVGVCGHGWETPADMRLELEQDGSVQFVDGSGGAAIFPTLPFQGPVAELVAGAMLARDGENLVVQRRNGRRFFFALPHSGDRELAIERIEDGYDNALRFVREGGELREIVESSGRRIVAESREGRVLELRLESPDRRESRLLVRYEYDGAQNLTGVLDPLLRAHCFLYANHCLVQHTDRGGLSFYYEYDRRDAHGRCLHTWGDGGLYDYRFSYEQQPRITRFSDSLGHAWTTEMDDAGLILAEIDPLGGRVEYEYDKAGRTSARVDAAGRRTEWHYDDAGNLIREVNPDKTCHAYGYDTKGRLISYADPSGAIWLQEWDDRRVVRRKQPDGSSWEFRYTDTGQVAFVRKPNGHTLSFEHDVYGNPMIRRSESGAELRLEYDLAGNVVVREDPDGSITRFAYDPCSQLTTCIQPSGARETCGYDAGGNPVLLQDPSGAQTRFEYSGLGELARRTDPDGRGVTYAYDPEERLIEVRNRSGRVQRFERDAAGRVVREVDAWNAQRSFSYDASGLLVERCDELGKKASFERDTAGRISRLSAEDGTSIELAYDPAGRLLRVENESGTLRRFYDSPGRLVREEQPAGHVSYAYDSSGNVTRRISSLGNVVEYAYDENDAVRSVSINRKIVIRISRDAAGRALRESLGAGLHRTFAYDKDGRRVRDELVGSSLRRARSYRYDRRGELVEWSDARGAGCSIEYDESARIQRFIRASRQRSEAAPRIEESLAESGARRWSTGTVTAELDAAGRVVSRLDATHGALTLTWNGLGRLQGASRDDRGACSFAYDGLGRRVAKASARGTTRFLWDRLALLGETDAQGRSREYVFYPGTFTPLCMIESDGSVYFYDVDPSGLPHAVLDAEGHVVWAARYDGTGKVLRIEHEELRNPLRFEGQYHDDETGLCYNLQRYFDPDLGQFISRDPLGLAAGDDPHEYAPNPWAWSDPTGLTCFPRKNLRGVQLRWLKRNKPKGWRQVPTRDNEGFIWIDESGIERLRYMRPSGKNPSASQWSRQANGYFRWQDEAGEFLDIDGNAIPRNHPQFEELTHIMYEGA